MVEYALTSNQLDRIFAALADSTRRAILKRLATGEASVTELAKPFKMSLPAVSKHLKVLERAGLIARGRDAQWRPCRLDPAPLKDIAEWVGEYQRFWEESFDRLDEYLAEVQKGGSGGVAAHDGQDSGAPEAAIPLKKKKDKKKQRKEKRHGRNR
jgi:DNA-binding transcriptional ArsR family regulator